LKVTRRTDISRSRKVHVLEPKILYELFGGSPIGWWSKGHHDPKKFCDAVIQECSLDIFTPVPEGVRHEYWRNVPIPAWGNDVMLYTIASGRGRGAYPVTVMYTRHCYISWEHRFGSYYYWRKNCLEEMRKRLNEIQYFKLFHTPSWDYHLVAYCKGRRWACQEKIR